MPERRKAQPGMPMRETFRGVLPVPVSFRNMGLPPVDFAL